MQAAAARLRPIHGTSPNNNPPNIRITTEKDTKMIFILSLCHVNLPLNANIGTSHTNNQQNRIMNKKRNKALKRGPVSQASLLEIKAPQKMAFAGVGIPINSVC